MASESLTAAERAELRAEIEDCMRPRIGPNLPGQHDRLKQVLRLLDTAVAYEKATTALRAIEGARGIPAPLDGDNTHLATLVRELADFRNAEGWMVECTGCAGMLDKSYADHQTIEELRGDLNEAQSNEAVLKRLYLGACEDRDELRGENERLTTRVGLAEKLLAERTEQIAEYEQWRSWSVCACPCHVEGNPPCETQCCLACGTCGRRIAGNWHLHVREEHTPPITSTAMLPPQEIREVPEVVTLTKRWHVCQCYCHGGGVVGMHIRACCQSCRHCGERIAGDVAGHEAGCEKRLVRNGEGEWE